MDVSQMTEQRIRLYEARTFLSPRLKSAFLPCHEDMASCRLLSRDGTMALQWVPGTVSDGYVELRTL